MFISLIDNILHIALAIANIVLGTHVLETGEDQVTLILDASFRLVGVPLILAALYGVSARQEPHIRLWVYYAILGVLIEIGLVIYFTVFSDVCGEVRSPMEPQGSAFACGATRMFSIALVLCVLTLQIYAVYVVWSVAEEIRISGAGGGLQALRMSSGSAAAKGANRYSEGLFGTSTVGGAFGIPMPMHYGSNNGEIFSGSTPIFGGAYHEINYPPAPI